MKAVLNPDTNEVLGFDDNMSDDAISAAISSDKSGRPMADANPTPYDAIIRPALEQAKLTGNNQILYDARRRVMAEDPFNKALAHGLTFGFTEDNDPEVKAAHGYADTLGNLTGQTASILATAGVGEALGLGTAATGVGSAAKGLLPEAAQAAKIGSGALLPVTAGELVANTAAGITSSAALGAMFNGITESVNQGKIFAEDHTAPDIAKIGESMLHGAVTWAPYGIGGAFIAKTAPGLASGTAAIAGTAYVVSKAEGHSEADARFNAMLMGIFHFAMSAPKLETMDRAGIVDTLQNTVANYTRAKNGMTEANNLHQMVGDEFIKQEAQGAIDRAFVDMEARATELKAAREAQDQADIVAQEQARDTANAQGEAVAALKAEQKANREAKRQQPIAEQFNDPYDPKLLDYLAEYIPAKEVARMSSAYRLELANGKWQDLRDIAGKFESGELPDVFAQRLARDAQLARTQDNTIKEVTSSDVLTKSLTSSVTQKVITAQEKPIGPEASAKGAGPAKAAPASTKAENAIIPTFKNTEEALAFGKGNAKNQAVQDELARLYAESKEKSGALIKSEKDADLQAGMDEAVRGQFFREALESAQGKIKPIVSRETKSQDIENKQVTKDGEAVSGLSAGIQAGLKEDFGDLPTYQKRDMAEIAKRATEFIAKDPVLAKKIALGEAPEQGDLRSQELFTALRIKAKMEGDIGMLRDLALSDKAAEMAAEAGQRVKALDTGEREVDEVAAIREIKRAREAVIKKEGKIKDVAKEKEATVKEIKKSIKKAQPKQEDWNDFLESIRC